MVPACQTVQLLVRQQVVLQQTLGERWVRLARCHRDQGYQRCAQVFDTVEVMVFVAGGAG